MSAVSPIYSLYMCVIYLHLFIPPEVYDCMCTFTCGAVVLPILPTMLMVMAVAVAVAVVVVVLVVVIMMTRVKGTRQHARTF